MDRLEIGGSFSPSSTPSTSKKASSWWSRQYAIQVAEEPAVLRSLTAYHGKPGLYASVEFKLKRDPVTMLGIASRAHEGRFKFVIAEENRLPADPGGER